MAAFPKTVDPATTNNVLPASTSLPLKDIDPAQIYVRVFVPGTLIRPGPNDGAETFYRLSDLINYIVALAQGR